MDELSSAVARSLMEGEQRRLNKLCEALGIPIAQSDSSKWEQVGKTLAKNHPAYTGKRIGRPIRPSHETVGDRRLRFVERIHQLHMPIKDEATVMAIKEYMRSDPEVSKALKPLFGQSNSTILTSISRERTRLSQRRTATEQAVAHLAINPAE